MSTSGDSQVRGGEEILLLLYETIVRLVAGECTQRLKA